MAVTKSPASKPTGKVLVIQSSKRRDPYNSRRIDVTETVVFRCDTVEQATTYINGHTCGANDEAEAYSIGNVTHTVRVPKAEITVEVIK